MGVKRKRLRREERLEEEEERDPRAAGQLQEKEKEKERPREREDTPVGRVLELQKTAGNRATTAAISRWGFPWFPATAAPQWPKEPQVILDGTTIPIESWSWAVNSSSTGTVQVEPQYGGDIMISAPTGKHSADLMRRTGEGRPFKTVFIVVPGEAGDGRTLTLTDVTISSYQVSGRVESWALSYAKKEFSLSPPQVQPRP